MDRNEVNKGLEKFCAEHPGFEYQWDSDKEVMFAYEGCNDGWFDNLYLPDCDDDYDVDWLLYELDKEYCDVMKEIEDMNNYILSQVCEWDDKYDDGEGWYEYPLGEWFPDYAPGFIRMSVDLDKIMAQYRVSNAYMYYNDDYDIMLGIKED